MEDAIPHFSQAITHAYQSARNSHGSLDIRIEDFAAHIRAIIGRRVGFDRSDAVIVQYLNALHTNDLYLATACALGSEAGWNRFNSIYEKFIRAVANFVSTSQGANELASNILVDLFLPDRSGESRIGSYEGRSSLATWLRVVICHRAANERERLCNKLDRLDSIPDIADDRAFSHLNAKLRTCRYERMIRSSLRRASAGLTERQRLLLLLRYREGFRLGEIARLLNVHQSTVTRQIEHACERIRQDTLSTLSTKYHLKTEAITECLEEVCANPSYSLLVVSNLANDQSYNLPTRDADLRG